MLVICLIKKHILAISSFSRPFFKDAFFVDAMFCAKTLPKYGAHWNQSQISFCYKATLAHFDSRIALAGVLQFLEA